MSLNALKVIFLDFDGPLFSERALLLEENNSKNTKYVCESLGLHPSVGYWKMDPVAISMLNALSKKFNLQFVISSSWANPILHSQEDILNLLESNGFQGKLHEDWCTKKVGAHRIEEISNWLNLHSEVEGYIVLDDNVSAPEMEDVEKFKGFSLNPNSVFLVSHPDGILMKDYNEMIKHFLSINIVEDK